MANKQKPSRNIYKGKGKKTNFQFDMLFLMNVTLSNLNYFCLRNTNFLYDYIVFSIIFLRCKRNEKKQFG